MADIVYPSAIPGATAFDCEPRERRLLSDDPEGKEHVRGRETDFNGLAQLQWEFTRVQASIFRTWGRVDLEKWTRKFAATLPGYLGFAQRVCRFKRPPTWDYVGYGPEDVAGYWIVSGEVEIYGRALIPGYPVLATVSPHDLAWP